MTIMKWLDYIFYRLYLHFVKKDVPPVFGASVVFALNIFSLTVFLWVSLLRFFSPNIGNKVYYIPLVIIVFLVWLWYKKRITKILDEFNNTESKSNYVALITIILTGIIVLLGAIVNVYVQNYFEK